MDKLPQNQSLDLIFVIDRSGSMWGSEEDTIGGFNSFIEREKNNETDTKVTTILFNNKYEVLYERKSIDDVKPLTSEEYFVGGSTALFDAIGNAVTSLNCKIENKTLFVIMTDGLENSSREFSKSQIRNMINNSSWEFIFIGADIDSYKEAGSIGFKKSRIANYRKSKEGIDDLYTSISSARDCVAENMSLDDAMWKRDLEKYD